MLSKVVYGLLFRRKTLNILDLEFNDKLLDITCDDLDRRQD